MVCVLVSDDCDFILIYIFAHSWLAGVLTKCIVVCDIVFTPSHHRVALIGGVIISSTMANTIQGAVKGVIVCYADHPGKMYENHPREVKELSDAIALVFPEVQVFAFGSSNFIV